jgi:uncharacterized membrane protein YhfC
LDDAILRWFLVSAACMMLVALGAVFYWRRLTGLQLRWFWLGAGLWFVAVAIKVAWAIATNAILFDWLVHAVSYPAYLVWGGLYGGVQSSLCEIGLTLLAVLIWRQLGDSAERAIGIGIGAGAFEAFLIGFGLFMGVLAALNGLDGTGAFQLKVQQAAQTPLAWLAPVVERVLAILCHASSRALVLLGVNHRRPWMLVGGFALFTYIDAIATAAQISGMMDKMSVWWIELAILPAAIVSVPILQWCYANWGRVDAPQRNVESAIGSV